MRDGRNNRRANVLATGQIEELRRRLDEAEQTLEAIRHGDVDALVVIGPKGEQVYSLAGAERVYRTIVETMNEAALTADADGTILFCNQQFCGLVKMPMEETVGRNMTVFTAGPQQVPLKKLLADARIRSIRQRLTLRASDGTAVPVQISASPLDTGERRDICLVASDLTEVGASAKSVRVLREHQQALEESEAKARDLIRYAPAGIYEIDFDGPKFKNVNDVMCHYLGYTREELLALNPFDLLDDKGKALFRERIRKHLAGRNVDDSVEFHVKGKNGHEFDAVLQTTVTYKDGKPAGVLVIAHDITERKRTQQQLEADMAALTRIHALSTRLLDDGGLEPLLEETMDAAVAIMGADGGTLQLLERESLRIVAHHGHQPPFLKFFAAAESQASACGEALKQGQRVVVADVERSPLFVGTASLTVLREAGVRAVQSTPLRDRQGRLLGILTTQWAVPHTPDEHDLWRLDLLARQAADLIEHKQVGEALRNANEDLRAQAEQLQTANDMLQTRQADLEEANEYLQEQGKELFEKAEALRESQERLAVAASGARIGIFDWNVVTGEVLWTEQAARLLGLRPTTTTTTTTLSQVYHYHDWAERVHPEDLGRVEAEIRRCMAEQKPYDAEYRVLWSDGSVHWLADRGVFQYDADGECFRVLGIIMDITDRKQAEEALRASEERLALAVSGTRIGIYEWNVVTGESLWTEQVARLLGLDVTASSRPHPYRDWADRIHPEDRARVEARVRRCMVERTPHESEYRIVWPDGSVHWVISRGVFQYDSQGCCTRLLGMIMDITERKQAEQILRIKENAIASSLNAIAMADPQGHLTYVNPAFLRLWGYDNASEVLGKSAADFWKAPEQAVEIMLAIQNGQGWTGELVAVRKDGARRNLFLSASVVLNDAGVPICMMASFIDITERKQAEEGLRESEARYRTLFESIDEGFCTIEMRFDDAGWPVDYRFLEVNPSFERQTGIENAPGRWMREIAPNHEEHWFEIYGRVAQTGEPVRFENPAKALGHFYDVYAFRVGPPEQRRVAILFNDISERKKAEETLRESEERFRKVFENASIGILIADADRHYHAVNDRFCEMMGRNRDELLTSGCGNLLHPDDQAGDIENVGRLLRGEVSSFTRDMRYIRSDGAIVWVRVNVSRLPGRQEDSPRLIATMEDITERKRIEEALRQRVEEVETLMKVAPAAIWVSRDPQCDGITGNPMADRFYETGERENVSANVSAARRFFRDGRELTPQELPMQEAAARNVDIGNTELDVLLPSGKWLNMFGSASPLRDGAGQVRGCVGTFVDITQRKQAEEALRELNATLESKVVTRTAELKQRTRELQRLTLELTQAEDRERKRVAEILHEDLQQQIAGAKFHLSLLRGRIRRDPALESIAGRLDELLVKAIEKSRNLSQELSPAVLHKNDLAEALYWLVNQMQQEHGLAVHVDVKGEMVLGSEALSVFLFRAVQELLFNVVKHAGVREAAVRVRRRGRNLYMSVSDGGCGFDPRGLKETTGYGLLSLHERVELLGGRMRIRSVPGKGSTFRIIVPDGVKEKAGT